MKRRKFILFVSLLLLMLAVASPALAGSDSLKANDTLTVTITVPQSAAQVSSAYVKVKFDNTVLEATDVRMSLKSTGGTYMAAVSDAPNANKNSWYACALASGSDTVMMNSDLVLTATFTVKKNVSGASASGLVVVDETEYFLSDHNGDDISQLPQLQLKASTPSGEVSTVVTTDDSGSLFPEDTPPAVTPSTPGENKQPARTMEDRARGVIIMQIDSNVAVADGTLVQIYSGEPSVTPYIESNSARTFIPVRFVAETMGAAVVWQKANGGVNIKSAEREIQMYIGKKNYTLNGKSMKMDAVPRLMHSTGNYARTVVPIRFVAEGLGYDVAWNETNRLVIIAPASDPWQPDGEAEKALINEALTMMTLFRSFAE